MDTNAATGATSLGAATAVDVIVIGGGLVGASAAYHLARDGARVTLVDRADSGQATAAGAGIIAPATYVDRSPAFDRLIFAAVAYYEELLGRLAEEGEPETGYDAVGALFVATDEEEVSRLATLQQVIAERQAAGVPNVGMLTRLDARGARALFPALAMVPAALHLSGAARVDGRLLRDALLRAATRRGARVVNGDAAPVVQGARVVGVRLGGETLAADAVIVAAGAWSKALGTSVGLAVPVYPQRGQILHLDLPDVETRRWPIVLGFHSHYLLTFPGSRVVMGATREHDSGYDVRTTAGGIREVLSEGLRLAPGLANATLREIRIGLRPVSPDGLPVLGAAPGLPNLFLATSLGPSGLQIGPYAGAIAAARSQGKPAPIDLTPYRAERFQG